MNRERRKNNFGKNYREPEESQYRLSSSCDSPAVTPADYRAWSRATFRRVRDWLPPDRRTPIVDLGCGAGQFLYLLNSLGYTDITGVDLSPARVEEARAAIPQARVMERDLREALATHPGRFGLITAFDVLEHISKNEVLAVLIQAAHALRPGGRLIVQAPNGESPWVGPVAYGDFTHEWIPTPKSLAELFSQAGLVSFGVRECGPVVHGFKSDLRFLLWQLMRSLFVFQNLVETGHQWSGIYSRVFLATACRSPLSNTGMLKEQGE